MNWVRTEFPSIVSPLRPIKIVKGKLSGQTGLFHGFFQNTEDDTACPVALIELPDGTLTEWAAEYCQFTDRFQSVGADDTLRSCTSCVFNSKGLPPCITCIKYSSWEPIPQSYSESNTTVPTGGNPESES